MALIKCTECGKTFSDKAQSCPECGCPTEHVLKEIRSAKTVAAKKPSGRQADDIILAEVQKAKTQARSADRLFDSRNRAIQRKASSSIDLFGGYATSTVVEIRAEAREACDDLYVTYQSLVESLDAACRPLLDLSPSGAAIKEVADAIRHFNEESKIESNFTASFNGSDLGNVANSKYVPRISNKMIQRFWEETYAKTPYAAEQAKKRQEAAERARKNREAERIRAEEERKRKAEEKRLEDLRKAEELEKAKKHKETVVSEANTLTDTFRRALDAETGRQLALLQSRLNDQIHAFEQQKKQQEQTLASLGRFAFGEKKAVREQIDLMSKRIRLLSDPQLVIAEEKKMRQLASDSLDTYKADMDAYLAKRFPGKVRNAPNEYAEAPEYANTALPAPPPISTLFETSK